MRSSNLETVNSCIGRKDRGGETGALRPAADIYFPPPLPTESLWQHKVSGWRKNTTTPPLEARGGLVLNNKGPNRRSKMTEERVSEFENRLKESIQSEDQKGKRLKIK